MIIIIIIIITIFTNPQIPHQPFNNNNNNNNQKKKKKGKLGFTKERCLSLVVIFHMFWGCLVCVFKQPFSVFKQHFTYFYILFHPHEFSQMFLNNIFQFLNTCNKRTLYFLFFLLLLFLFLSPVAIIASAQAFLLLTLSLLSTLYYLYLFNIVLSPVVKNKKEKGKYY